MTNAIAAHGTLLKQGDAATPTEAFTTVAEVTALGGPSLSSDMIDVTSHDSTNAWREFIQGLKDGGEVSLTINYIPTNATHDASTGLLNDYENGTLRNFQLVFPDGSSTTWTIAAYVRDYQPSANPDSQLSADIVLKLSGQPTLA